MKKPLLTIWLTLCAVSAWAGIEVQRPWVRATVPHQSTTGAFMSIKSDHATRLVEVKTPVAKLAQVHEMKMTGETMEMRPLTGLDIPAGKPIELDPGAFHIMLLDLNKQLNAGDTVPLTLIFEDASHKREVVEVKARVRSLGANDNHGE